MAFFRNFATVGSLTLLSRFLGFLRELLSATLLGTGPVGDAFVVAQRLPNFFRAVFAEGAMDTAFIPIYTRKLALEGPAAAAEFSRQIFTLMLIVLTPFTLVALFHMPVIVNWLVPGFAADPLRFRLAVLYCSITFIYLTLISVTALQGGILNANNRFAAPAIAPILMNFVMIGALVGAAALHADVGLIACWALIMGGAVQMIFLWFFCIRAGVMLSLTVPKITKDVRKFFMLGGPGIIGTATVQLGGLISTILSSSLPGGAVAALYYSDRLLQFPIAVVGIAITTALLPLLTKHIAAREKAKAVYFFSRSMEVGLALSLPLFLILLLEAEPIIRVLFKHGAFTDADVKMTSECLMGYAGVIPGFVIIRIMNVCFFSNENSMTPLIVGLVAIVFNVAGSLLLMPVWAHVGIAISFTFSVWINVVLLGVLLVRDGNFHLDDEAKKRLPRIFFAGLTLCLAFMSLNLLEPEALFSFIPSRFFQTGAALLLRLVCAGFIYIAAIHLTGALRFHEMKRFLKKARGTHPPTEV